ncbi:hypothetical protein [Alphaproteobacteria bacterium endosymbiont of Tiliacea citrago]|uniref:hypothetical protein n=1 Tax=Alphaproteobacteria bacterium endosymbiont of Tiliacea citrago TaxID=3077944 RepID=UPI00313C09E0
MKYFFIFCFLIKIQTTLEPKDLEILCRYTEKTPVQCFIGLEKKRVKKELERMEITPQEKFAVIY